MQMNLKKENNEFITIMLKLVGTACNMCCQYCYEHVAQNNKNFFSTAEDVKQYLKRYVEYKHVFLVFHGGEPLLAKFDEIKKILIFIRDNFKYEYRIQFQTNGTLLNDKWIELFQEYEPNISLSISIDPIGKLDLRKAQGFNYRNSVENNLDKYSKSIANIGIISVVHKYNIAYFESFISDLINKGIKSVTINKIQGVDPIESYGITEMEYVNLIIGLSKKYISKGWYKTINIQPINSLFSRNGNRICTYLADEHKCLYFNTYYSLDDITSYCDHIVTNVLPEVPKKCFQCDIYSKCGGGCLAEKKDDTFCEARHKLFEFIKEVTL